MLVDVSGSKQLKITLTAVEICDYFGNFGNMRYDNAEARTALGSILLDAMDSTGFKISSERLIVKVYPTQSGGCTIYFIQSQKPRRLHKASHSFIFEFDSCENLLLAAEQIKKLGHHDTQLSIYKNGHTYRLIISGEQFCPSFFKIGIEYSDRVPDCEYDLEKTKEYWREICVNTPVSKICL